MLKNCTALAILFLGFTTAAQQKIWYVEMIVFAGNENIHRNELITLMKLQPPGFFTHTEYSFSKLVNDISAINRYYYSKGYLSASVQIAGIERDTAIQGVVIRLRIDEGIQTIVESIAFSGNSNISDLKLSTYIPLKENAPLDSAVYERSRRIIKDSLASRGYILANVDRDIKINEERDCASIVYKIEEGPMVLRGDLEIVGAKNVKRKVIEREVALEKGDIMTAYKIALTIRHLYGTGLFDYVLFEPMDTGGVSSEADTVTFPVLIQLDEADMFSLQLGGGYSTEDGLYGTVEVSYANLFSLGHRISAETRLSDRFSDAQIVYSYPWVFGIPLFADLAAFIERREEVDFTGLFTGGYLSLTSRIDMSSLYRGWIMAENTLWLHDFGLDLDSSSGTRGNFVLLGAGYTCDMRNNIVNPDNGFLAFIEAEIAGPWIPWSDKFYRLKGNVRKYVSVFESKLILTFGLFAGYVKEYGADRNVPPQELFRVGEGGVRPVRGYTDDEVVFPNENAGGGKFALILTPLEVTFPLYKILRGALFVDCGVIWQSPNEFDLNDLRWSVGPGLRLVNLPIGLVRLDYGIQINRDLNFKARIHFGIGATF